jgi:hypothetical protein
MIEIIKHPCNERLALYFKGQLTSQARKLGGLSPVVFYIAASRGAPQKTYFRSIFEGALHPRLN